MVIENWKQAAVVVVGVLAAAWLLWALRHRIKRIRVRLWSVAVEAADEPDPTEQVVHTRRTRMVKSLISTTKSGKVGLVDSKVKKSAIVVRKDDDPEPGAG